MHGLMMNTQLTVTSLMRYAEQLYPDTEIVSVTLDNPRHRTTFKQAFKRSRQLANVLTALGAKQGDRIATLAWNDYRHFELYFALNCGGYVCHTINPRLFPKQIEFIVNQAEDQWVFLDPLFVPLLEKLAPVLPTVKGYIVLTDEAHMPGSESLELHCYETLLAAQSDDFIWPELDENSACGLCYTSGTSGDPKGVVYSHRATVLHSWAISSKSGFNLNSSDVLMPIVPMFHVNAWGSPYAACMTGCKLVMPGPKMIDGETLAALINDEQVSLSAGVPTIWAALLDYLKSSGSRVDSLKRIVVGGAACPLSLMEGFDEYDVYTEAAWGMTETCPLGSFNSKLDREALGEEAFAKLRLKAGKPVFGVEMKIVDDKNQPLPWNGEAFGDLKVRGPWVASGYYKLENSDSFDSDGWFATGDVATIDEHGLMQITDRSKDVIKSGGEWISSIELENVAVSHPAVAQAAVIGLPHPKWTERPLLVVVPTEEKVEANELLAWLDGKVAKWWIPDDCEFVEALPMTATGKISKKDLREQFGDYRFSV